MSTVFLPPCSFVLQQPNRSLKPTTRFDGKSCANHGINHPVPRKIEFEREAIHLAAWDEAGKLIGVGRLHRIDENCGQIRYMAVDPAQRSQGVGKAILQELEVRAIESGIQEIKLNSRQDAVQFYRKTVTRF